MFNSVNFTVSQVKQIALHVYLIMCWFYYVLLRIDLSPVCVMGLVL